MDKEFNIEEYEKDFNHQQIIENQKQKIEEKVISKLNPKNKNYIKIILFVVVVLSISVAIPSIYRSNFPYSLSSSQTEWGAFGDYIGGILNPLFTLITIALLCYTLFLQSKTQEQANLQLRYSRKEMELSRLEMETTRNSTKEEMELTRGQMKLSRQEMEGSKDALKKQVDHLEKQTISSNFFNLIDLYNQITSYIIAPDSLLTINDGFFKNEFKGKNAFIKINYILVTEFTSATTSEKKILLTYLNNYSHYLDIVITILSFLENADLSKKEEELYIKIFKSSLSKQEIILIFHVFRLEKNRDNSPFYKLIIKYSLLSSISAPSLYHKYDKDFPNSLNLQFQAKVWLSELSSDDLQCFGKEHDHIIKFISR